MEQEEVWASVRWGGVIKLSGLAQCRRDSEFNLVCQVGKVSVSPNSRVLALQGSGRAQESLFSCLPHCAQLRTKKKRCFYSLTYSNGPMAYLGFPVLILFVLSAQKHKSEVLGTPTYM